MAQTTLPHPDRPPQPKRWMGDRIPLSLILDTQFTWA